MAIDYTNFNALVDDDGTGLVGTIWNKAQIQNVILAPVDGALGSFGWYAYTPGWSSLGSVNPVVGNGYLVGRYFIHGKTVVFQMFLMTGSTTTYGDNIWRFTLPYPGMGWNAARPPFPFVMQAMNAAGGPSAAIVATGIDAQSVYGVCATGATLGPSAPFTWNAGCSLAMIGMYETP